MRVCILSDKQRGNLFPHYCFRFSSAIISLSNGAEFMGKHMRVDSANSSGVYDRHRSVFVGNIPFSELILGR